MQTVHDSTRRVANRPRRGGTSGGKPPIRVSDVRARIGRSRAYRHRVEREHANVRASHVITIRARPRKGRANYRHGISRVWATATTTSDRSSATSPSSTSRRLDRRSRRTIEPGKKRGENKNRARRATDDGACARAHLILGVPFRAARLDVIIESETRAHALSPLYFGRYTIVTAVDAVS